ncbi:hypothetical protein K0M31_014078, partial [Melipona bicolor]
YTDYDESKKNRMKIIAESIETLKILRYYQTSVNENPFATILRWHDIGGMGLVRKCGI